MDISQYIKDGRIHILAKPQSPKTEVIGWDDSRKSLRVAVHAQPEDNKANIELVKFFRKLTGKEVKIISGHTSKQKLLEFTDSR